MLDTFMVFFNILFIGLLVLDWRLEGQGHELIFTTGILRLIVVFPISLELLEKALNLL